MKAALQKNVQDFAQRSVKAIDKFIAGRLRLRRTQIGMTQAQLGGVLGISFQQIQKYENGTNRIAFSRLIQLGSVLEVPLDWFVEGLPAEVLPHIDPSRKGSQSAPTLHMSPEILEQEETLKLIRAYYGISDTEQRRKLYQLIKSMGVGQD